MDISSILNIGLQNPDLSAAFTGSDPASEINFGDVLGSAISANAADAEIQTDGITEEVLTEDGLTANDGKSFAELVGSFKEDVDKAGEDVIMSAVKMMLSVGNASQRFMNGASDEKITDDEEGGDDVISVLSGMISLVVSDPEEDYVSDEETGLALLLADVSEVIRGGIKEGKTPEEIVTEFKKLAQDGDEDMNTLVEAVVSMMSELSAAGNEESLPDENEITFEGAAKTAAVTLVLSEDTTAANKAETILSVIKDNTNFKDEKTFEDFIESVKIAFSPEKTAETDNGTAGAFVSVHKTAAYARINDVSAEIGRMIGSSAEERETPVDFTVSTAAVPSFAANETPVIEVEIPEDTVTVYKELADFAVEQITRTVLDAPQDNDSAVKELTVVLKPENLGEIAVKLTQDTSGTISVVLAASNQEVGRALAENASALSESFAKQNMEVDTVNVVAPSEAASYMGLDFTNQGFERRNNEAQQTGNGSKGTVSAVGSIDDADEAEVTTAKKLLKEAKLWLMA